MYLLIVRYLTGKSGEITNVYNILVQESQGKTIFQISRSASEADIDIIKQKEA
jgi:hypothetical protein